MRIVPSSKDSQGDWVFVIDSFEVMDLRVLMNITHSVASSIAANAVESSIMWTWLVESLRFS